MNASANGFDLQRSDLWKVSIILPRVLGIDWRNNYWYTKNVVYQTEADAIAAGNLYALPVFEEDKDLCAGADVGITKRYDITVTPQVEQQT